MKQLSYTRRQAEGRSRVRTAASRARGACAFLPHAASIPIAKHEGWRRWWWIAPIAAILALGLGTALAGLLLGGVSEPPTLTGATSRVYSNSEASQLCWDTAREYAQDPQLTGMTANGLDENLEPRRHSLWTLSFFSDDRGTFDVSLVAGEVHVTHGVPTNRRPLALPDFVDSNRQALAAAHREHCDTSQVYFGVYHSRQGGFDQICLANYGETPGTLQLCYAVSEDGRLTILTDCQ